ncbi:MAG TPA: right-handed parallel beta-helix repeat-containing protein [Acetobacteraceae bacterium]|jgi:hypothetical protein|nr:right-handed parallel beta-helix repeat-containing protein [Acetobacteraceae bacterium]
MTVLNVAVGQSIQAAINAANPGDTIDVAAGVYTDQFLSIDKSLTLQAVDGEVQMVETRSPDDGKAMITEHGDNVVINGFEISGVTVPDRNGAAIRYEGGNLSLSNDYFHDNQDGILGAADPNGSITIDHSEFSHNGDGSGSTHNLYIGQIASFTLTNSYIHDAVVGHEVKSRAANNTITGNRIFDNGGSASYSIDLPNGGNAQISNNVIEQGGATQNPFIVAYAEEGVAAGYGNSVALTGNTVVNDDTGSGRGILDANGTTIGFTNNSVFGLTGGQLSTGPLAQSGTVLLASRPSLDTSSMTFINPSSGGANGGGGTGGTGGTGGGGDGGGTGGGGTTEPPPPPPPPPPALTLDQYHQMAVADFSLYATAHPEVWMSSSALSAIVFEMTTPTIPTTHVAGDLWS